MTKIQQAMKEKVREKLDSIHYSFEDEIEKFGFGRFKTDDLIKVQAKLLEIEEILFGGK